MEKLFVSFTGHRPDKLPGKYDWDAPANQKLMKKIEEICTWLMEGNPDKRVYFYFGGALGVDQMAFEVCYKLKKQYGNRMLLAICVPFQKQSNAWKTSKSVERYQKQLDEANFVINVDEAIGYNRCKNVPIGEYSVEKMQIRNEFMVDHSDLTIAVFDGTKGGTKNCVDYAIKKGNELIVIHPKTLDVYYSFL